MDVQIDDEAQNSDVIKVNGSVSGSPTINFNNLSSKAVLISKPVDVISYRGKSSLNPVVSGLPTTGAVLYRFQDNGDAWQLRAGASPAIGGLATGIVLTQSLMGSVINRPSSPYVTGRAVPSKNPCGFASWSRAQGGHAKLKGSTATDLGRYYSKVSADYGGFQLGSDYSCFEGYFNGWDMSFGGIVGYNTGTTSQDIHYFDPYTGKLNHSIRTSRNRTKFHQFYGGGYLGLVRSFEQSRNVVVADLQIRLDRTRYRLKNHPYGDALDEVNKLTVGESLTVDDLRFGVRNQKYHTDGKTFSGSAGYSVTLNKAKDLRIVPLLGFSLSNVKVDNLEFDDGVLKTKDINSYIGFGGLTLSKTYILPSGASAANFFATGTVYKDFAKDVVSDFYQYDSSQNLIKDGLRSKSTRIGTYGEFSAGVNYTKLFNHGRIGPPQQMDTSLRVDGRRSRKLHGWSVTLQGRLQF